MGCELYRGVLGWRDETSGAEPLPVEPASSPRSGCSPAQPLLSVERPAAEMVEGPSSQSREGLVDHVAVPEVRFQRFTVRVIVFVSKHPTSTSSLKSGY